MPEPDCFLRYRISHATRNFTSGKSDVYVLVAAARCGFKMVLRPTAAARRGFTMVLFTETVSRLNTFVGALYTECPSNLSWKALFGDWQDTTLAEGWCTRRRLKIGIYSLHIGRYQSVPSWAIILTSTRSVTCVMSHCPAHLLLARVAWAQLPIQPPLSTQILGRRIGYARAALYAYTLVILMSY